MTEIKQKSFVKSAAILGIAGILVQVMGAIFRIPLANIIGDDGMGYYQTAYPIYVALLVFSTNGAPAAISKMTSERIAQGRYREAHRVFRLSFILMGIMGALFFGAVALFANQIIEYFGDPGAYYALLAISPALLFVPIMAVFRGYFQGMQEMGPTAVSQLAEQATRVALGLTLAIMLVSSGIDKAAAGATIGTSIGPLVSILVLYIIYLKKRTSIKTRFEEDTHGEKESSGSIIKTLALIAVPITIGVSIMPIMNLGDLLFVIPRLKSIGYSVTYANSLYGQLTGMAIPVINVPMALALSMALAMVPAIAAANSVNNKSALENNIRLGMRMAMLIGVPCSLGIMSIARQVMLMLYPLQRESAESAADCLWILAVGVVFLCIGQTTAGILQGLGKPGLSVWGLLAGFVVKCISTYILTAMPSLNVKGAAWGSVLGFVTIGILNYIAVRKVTGIRHDLMLTFVKPILSGAIMYGADKLAYAGFNMVRPDSMLVTLIVICFAAAVYGLCILKSHAIAVEEIEMLPKGTKLAKLIRKLHLA